MNSPLVTVVVPVYKVENYLDRCISSIVNQTYTNLEIILVDDGSPDRCPQNCDVWAKKDSRIQVVHKENAGLGMARNTGIERACGEYICFFDSDDYIAPDTIEKACALANREQAEAVVFGVCHVSSRGKVMKRRIPAGPKLCYQDDEVQNVFLPDLIDGRHKETKIKNLGLSAWSGLFSMELLRRTNWRFVSERQILSEDSYSLIWLYKYVSKVAILPEALYYYCENDASLSRAFRPDRFAEIQKFYLHCGHMAVKQGYSDAVISRIGGLFLSFTIAAMKQIVAADMKNRQKRAMLREITEDSLFRKVISESGCRNYGKARKVLFWALQNQQHSLVWLLIKLRTWKDKLY